MIQTDRVVVNSQTSEMVKYVVTLVGNEPIACTCPNYNFRAGNDPVFTCKHMRSVKDTRPLGLGDLHRIRTILGRG